MLIFWLLASSQPNLCPRTISSGRPQNRPIDANTAFVGIVVVVITLALAVPAGYALARMTGAWAQNLGSAIFLTYLVPPTILFIPFSRIISDLGLQNSLWSLVLVYPSFTVPFCTWLLMGFFKAIPRDLEDAAMIDGLSRFGAFFEGGNADLDRRSADRSDICLYFGSPGVCLWRDLHHVVGELHCERGRANFPGSRRCLFLGFDDGLIVSMSIAIPYNLFVDRFVVGFTVEAIK